MPDSGFIDFYELLQISPNAEPETIHRVYKMLAARYHPDNPETADVDRFVLLNQAFEVLSDAQLRSAYNGIYETNRTQPIALFETKDFSIGVDGEANRRMGVLGLLYNRRRSNPDDAGLSLLEFESMMQMAREHLMFTMWYLKEKHLMRQDESSDYVITGEGADYVEANLKDNKLLYRLLKAAESGSSPTATNAVVTNPEPANSDANHAEELKLA